MKSYLLILFALICCSNLLAQDYIITASGESKEVAIKKPRFSYLLHHEIKAETDGKTSSFLPNELKGYTYGEHVFETFDIGEKKTLIKFLKVITKGYCTLYSYEYIDAGIDYGVAPNPMQEPPMSKVITRYYLKKEGEKIHAYDFKKLTKAEDQFFADNKALTDDLQHKKYRKADVQKIVERYNQERK